MAGERAHSAEEVQAELEAVLGGCRASHDMFVATLSDLDERRGATPPADWRAGRWDTS